MSTIFIDEVQAANILQQMWQECETDQFCDVILIAGEIKIPAHRAILSTATGYFKGMFTRETLCGSKEKEVKIHGVDGNALKSLIQFFYIGRVEIREDNVEELLETADMLLLNNVVTACEKFLTEQLDPTNCLGFTLLAERFHCQSLLEYAKKYTLEHFGDVYKTQEFLKLNNEQLGQLLASDNLSHTSEEHVFKSLMLWTKHDKSEREKYVNDLLKLVRMPLLDPKFLYYHVKPVCTSTECRQLYLEVMEWHLLQDPCVLNPSISVKPRNSSQYLMGITRSRSNNKMYIHYYCPQRFKWMKWMNDLEYRCYFGIATMGHNIYIAGGRDSAMNVLNTVLCLNMKTMTLSPVNAMTEHRSACSAAVTNGFLYVLGGFDEINSLRSVERWDPQTNTWSEVASMSVGRYSFGIAKLNTKIYAIGGNRQHDIDILSSVEEYDSSHNVWTSIASMSGPRCSHGAAVANGILYAVGGTDLKTVERYDSLTNQWSIISNLHENLVHPSSCTIFHDKIVVCYKDRVDEYDATTNEWKTSHTLKGLPNLHCIFSYSGEVLTSEFAEN